MAKHISIEPRSLGRRPQGKSRKTKRVSFQDAPKNLTSFIRGLYGRVALQVGVDPSYVSRVASSERRSKVVEAGLRRELNKIVNGFEKQRAGTAQNKARKKRTSGGRAKSLA
ncbi:MAG: hypothetical protein LAO08_17810 [Acidobacteriia bacterium]|nr:hypothetical protein [Terriglobia bacterium]